MKDVVDQIDRRAARGDRVALATVVAELVAVRFGRDGGRLSKRQKGSIH